MTFKHYLIVMAIGTLGAWIAWTVTLVSINPIETSMIGFIFFYLTLFVALVGSFSIIGAGLRVLIKKPDVISRQVSIAFRHGLLFGSLIIGSLILLSQDILYWWSMTLFIAVMALVEIFFLTSRRGRKTPIQPEEI